MSDSGRDALKKVVISTLDDAVQDWDLDLEEPIEGSTTLIDDLGFESIDIVQLCVALEEALEKKGLPFEQLFIQDGAYVSDVTVDQITDFLAAELNRA
ncbi:acyl carrier protein [Pseudoroseicyclus sp. H15]